MKKSADNSVVINFKHLFGDFQFVLNTAIDNDDVKHFLMLGIKRILNKEKKYCVLNLVGLLLLITGVLRFVGLCVFLATLCYIGVQLTKFISGVDDQIFEEVKIEMEKQETIPQSSMTEYVKAQINKKKINRRRS